MKIKFAPLSRLDVNAGEVIGTKANIFLSSKLLKNIPDDSLRHSAEWWLLSNEYVRSNELHNSKINHYEEEYPLQCYKDDSFECKKV